MENFTAFNPTRLHFGKGAVNALGADAAKLGKSALFVFGGGSVMKNGSYRDAKEQLQKRGIEMVEYGGIRPNPVVEDVEKAAAAGREHKVDMVLAVGGGSVIDSAKIISICIAEECDAWEVMTKQFDPTRSVPLLAVLTLAATGTEMNSAAVLQNRSTGQKIGLRHDLNYPFASYLDPTYTLSVPKDYTAYGITDLVAHCLEAWFGYGDAALSDRFVVSIIREAMDFSKSLLDDLTNYKLRERMMWAATNALNNLTTYGKKSGDWGVHALGHVLSFLYDTPHGASLSIMYPAWMKVLEERAGLRIGKLGRDLFGVEGTGNTIDSLTGFFASIESPVRCQEAGITSDHRPEILDLMNRNNSQGLHYKLSDEDREKILDLVF